MVHHMSRTKIFVIHLKEIIYTAIFAGLGILLILLLIIMFLNKKDDSAPTMATPKYTPGVWSSSILINDTSLNIEVVLDEDHINSVRVVNIDEAVTAMYPLIEPALDDITEQIEDGVSLDSITISENHKYTQQLLLDAVKATIAKAEKVTPDK